jgi:hypothetical protein
MKTDFDNIHSYKEIFFLKERKIAQMKFLILSIWIVNAALVLFINNFNNEMQITLIVSQVFYSIILLLMMKYPRKLIYHMGAIFCFYASFAECLLWQERVYVENL